MEILTPLWKYAPLLGTIVLLVAVALDAKIAGQTPQSQLGNERPGEPGDDQKNA